MIEFVSGALCSKATLLSAMEKQYVGGNRKSSWVPGLSVDFHLTSTTHSKSRGTNTRVRQFHKFKPVLYNDVRSSNRK
jgi:hypothetical protein